MVEKEKHFIVIARALAVVEPKQDKHEAHSAWVDCCDAICDALSDGEPEFPIDTFLTACGLMEPHLLTPTPLVENVP